MMVIYRLIMMMSRELIMMNVHIFDETRHLAVVHLTDRGWVIDRGRKN